MVCGDAKRVINMFKTNNMIKYDIHHSCISVHVYIYHNPLFIFGFMCFARIIAKLKTFTLVDFREAVVFAKTHFSRHDPLINDLLGDWANKLSSMNSYEHAAEWRVSFI